MAPLPILKSTIILDLLYITDRNYIIISHQVTLNRTIATSTKRDLQTAYVAYFLIVKNFMIIYLSFYIVIYIIDIIFFFGLINFQE